VSGPIISQQIQDGGRRKNTSISVLDEDICKKWYKNTTRLRTAAHVTKNGTGS